MQTAPDNVLQVELSNEKYERECIYHSPIGCWKEGFSIHAKEADQVDSNDSGTMSARKRCLPWDSSLWKSCFRLEAPEPGKNTLSSQIAKLARSAGKSHMPLQAETIAHDDLIWAFFLFCYALQLYIRRHLTLCFQTLLVARGQFYFFLIPS